MKALIVDDDLALADVLSFTLRRAGYAVTVANDGLAALQRWEQDKPDFIILDLNLPQLSGLEVCKHIRSQSDVPILILSVRGDDDDVVRGLQEGADEYMVKPFSPRQLTARIEAVLRRAGNAAPMPESFSIGGLTLDVARRELSVGGKPGERITPLENRLLQILMLNKDMVLSTDALIGHVWGQGGGDRAMLKQLIYRLRGKLEGAPPESPQIETIPGVGYSLATSRRSKVQRPL